MTRTKLVLFFAVLAGLLVPAGIQAAGTRVYVKIVGKTQGTFKGEATRVAGTNYIDVYRYNYGVISPRDPSTGLPTGKRQQQSVIITKEIDATSPQIFQALISNETMTTVTIEFLTNSTDGKELTYYVVTLKNATIAEIHQHMDQASATSTGAPPVSTEPLEDVSFSFEQIEFTSNVGQTTAADSWNNATTK
jgi:type VI secretion system secreted protein Hcp